MNTPDRWFTVTCRRALLPLAGLAALIWFVIRVLPRPSRAAYPCQRAAFPLASGFVLWAVSLVASWAGLRQAGVLFARGRFVLATGLLVVAAGAGGYALFAGADGAAAATTQERFAPSEGANRPMGTPKGIFPGRVVWIHDPGAAHWDGAGKWWRDDSTDPEAVTAMLSTGLQSLTGTATNAAAWEALFRHFNRTHGRGDRGYAAGERIAAKLNSNQAGSPGTDGNQSFTAPQLAAALVRQLHEAGVAAADITLYDATRSIPAPVRAAVQAVAPEVRFVTFAAGRGCEAHVRDPAAQMRWSQELTLEADGGNPTFLPTCVTEATYLINLAGLKGHSLAGVTLTAKNHFGSISADLATGESTTGAPRAAGLHPYAAVHEFRKGGNWDFDGRAMGTYSSLTDLIGHRELSGKTLLYLIDGLYAVQEQGQGVANSQRWDSAPFDGGWTASLFVSQDPLAIDSVALDFMIAEPTMVAVYGNVDNYLHEAALADAAPSGTVYDPEGDGVAMASLGVHEHWNNAEERLYTGNLGGSGVELYIPGHATAVTEPAAVLPASTTLRAYPNPFNATVTLAWSQSRAARVRLLAYDVLGRQVVVLRDDIAGAGAHTLRWDGTDATGRPLASGTYFVRLLSGTTQRDLARVTLIR